MIKRLLLLISVFLLMGVVIVYFVPMGMDLRYKLLAILGLPLVLIVGGSLWIFLSGLITKLIILVVAVVLIGLLIYYYVL
ncbi:MAG: hypothetical protein NTV30_03755 [Chloroflexi bacterium]|nr:hypothetical protein [Chloroflexota bacterium]